MRAACEDSLRRLGHRPHRPLPTPLPRRHGAHRRHAGRAARTRRGGQGPRDRLLEPHRRPNCARRSAAAGDGPAFVSVQNQYSLLEREPETRRRPRGLRGARHGILARSTRWPTDCSPARCARASRFPKGTRLAKMAPERSVHWLGDELQSQGRRPCWPTPSRVERADPVAGVLVAAEPPPWSRVSSPARPTPIRCAPTRDAVTTLSAERDRATRRTDEPSWP